MLDFNLFNFLINSILGIGLITLPVSLYEFSYSSIFSFFLISIYFLFMTFAFSKFDTKKLKISDALSNLFGDKINVIINYIYLVNLTLGNIYILHCFFEFLKINSPFYSAFIYSLFILSIYITYNVTDAFSKYMDYVTCIMKFIPLIVVVAYYLIYGNNYGIHHVGKFDKNMFLKTSFSLTGIEAIMFFDSNKNKTSTSLLAISLIILLQLSFLVSLFSLNTNDIRYFLNNIFKGLSPLLLIPVYVGSINNWLVYTTTYLKSISNIPINNSLFVVSNITMIGLVLINIFPNLFGALLDISSLLVFLYYSIISIAYYKDTPKVSLFASLFSIGILVSSILFLIFPN